MCDNVSHLPQSIVGFVIMLLLLTGQMVVGEWLPILGHDHGTTVSTVPRCNLLETWSHHCALAEMWEVHVGQWGTLVTCHVLFTSLERKHYPENRVAVSSLSLLT